MSVNIREATMQHVEIFGKPALFINQRPLRNTVPVGWYCYELRGSDKKPSAPTILADHVTYNHAGTILSPVPLKKATTAARRLSGQFYRLNESISLADFCKAHGLEYPHNTRKDLLRPASPYEAGLFYSNEKMDQELACVGHLRLDFGSGGHEFWSTWWPHNDDEYNTAAFKLDFDPLVNELRERGPLKDMSAMTKYCYEHVEGDMGEPYGGNYGFLAETEDYLYCLRCTLQPGNYNGYLYAYDKCEQRMNEAMHDLCHLGNEQQQIKFDIESAQSHSYKWAVFENLPSQQLQILVGANLEDAIMCYRASDSNAKRLCVSKDNAVTAALVVTLDGVQRFSKAYQRMEPLSADPVIMEAVKTLRQELAEQTPAREITMGSM